MNLFSFKSKSCLGVDIGTSGVKIVELIREKNKVKLVSYGFSEDVPEGEKFDWRKNPDRIARIISLVREKSGMSSSDAISSLPTFSVFSSLINLAKMDKKDLSSAVQWEAKKVVPLPLEEMKWDWVEVDEGESGGIKVLLTAAPKFLVEKYIEIFKLAKLNLLSLEAENLSLIRAILGNDPSTVMLVDIGRNTTDISIAEKGIPILNRSIDSGGDTITKAISRNLNISAHRAEQFKYDLGISSLDSSGVGVPKAILDAVSPIVDEIRYTLNLFQDKNKRSVEKVVLSGGGALLANLADHLSKTLDKKTIIGDPWFRISYPLDLEPLLKELSPKLAVAVGLAMREM